MKSTDARRFSLAHLLLSGVLCLVLGGIIGAAGMASSKAGQIAAIIVERDKQLTAIQEKHAAELQRAYAAVKEKAGDAFNQVSAEELGETVQTETEQTLKQAGTTARGLLKRLGGKTESPTDSLK